MNPRVLSWPASGTTTVGIVPINSSCDASEVPNVRLTCMAVGWCCGSSCWMRFRVRALYLGPSKEARETRHLRTRAVDGLRLAEMVVEDLRLPRARGGDITGRLWRRSRCMGRAVSSERHSSASRRGHSR
eukprot:1851919-Prymnesium_polylepis.2